MDLNVKIVEIKGNCPVYKVGNTFSLKEGYKLVADIPICMHALSALMPYYNVLQISEPGRWGLAGKSDPHKAYIQCLDPMCYTGGGTVTFEISKAE